MRPWTALALVALSAGCATLGGGLLNASDALEERSGELYQEMRDDAPGGPGVAAAEKLARAAVDFRRAVERDSPREDLDAAFNRISGAYQGLRECIERGSADPQVRDRLRGITDAYMEVEGALRFRVSEFSSGRKVR
jgi:hypothetical protein